MFISVQVTQEELGEMGCDSIEQLAHNITEDLDKNEYSEYSAFNVHVDLIAVNKAN